ncbi:MAG: class I SAM-dependent methyltransferase [Dehalococcoidales bacterium]|nr:class I SAM-dependent methyltransferase [Dehalococcoidales bacterium]
MTEKKKEPLFNAGAAVYDSFKFLHVPAERTALLADLKPGQAVLDVACGSGRTAITASGYVGDTGRVIGIDIADKLLEVAKNKAAESGLTNIIYRSSDAQELEFDNEQFDAVLCASSIFLFDDIRGALIESLRVLKPGGVFVFSAFTEGVFSPVVEMINTRLLLYPSLVFPLPVTSVTDTPEKCLALIQSAGLPKPEMFIEKSFFYAGSVDECWRQVANSLLVRPRLALLDKEDYQRIKQEVQSELEPMLSSGDIKMEVPTIYCKISKPQ